MAFLGIFISSVFLRVFGPSGVASDNHGSEFLQRSVDDIFKKKSVAKKFYTFWMKNEGALKPAY